MDNYEKIALETAIVTEYQAAYHKQKALEELEEKYKAYGYDKTEIIKVLQKNGAYKAKATIIKKRENTKDRDVKIVQNIENKSDLDEKIVKNAENTKDAELSETVIKVIAKEIGLTKKLIKEYDEELSKIKSLKEKQVDKMLDLQCFLTANGIPEQEEERA